MLWLLPVRMYHCIQSEQKGFNYYILWNSFHFRSSLLFMTYAITYANSTSKELVWKTKPKVYYTADNYLWYMFDINSH